MPRWSHPNGAQKWWAHWQCYQYALAYVAGRKVKRQYKDEKGELVKTDGVSITITGGNGLCSVCNKMGPTPDNYNITFKDGSHSRFSICAYCGPIKKWAEEIIRDGKMCEKCRHSFPDHYERTDCKGSNSCKCRRFKPLLDELKVNYESIDMVKRLAYMAMH